MEVGDGRPQNFHDVLPRSGDGGTKRGPQEIHARRESELQGRSHEIEELAALEHGDHILNGVADLGSGFRCQRGEFLGKRDGLLLQGADGIVDRSAKREEYFVDRVLERGEQAVGRLALRLHHPSELAALGCHIDEGLLDLREADLA